MSFLGLLLLPLWPILVRGSEPGTRFGRCIVVAEAVVAGTDTNWDDDDHRIAGSGSRQRQYVRPGRCSSSHCSWGMVSQSVQEKWIKYVILIAVLLHNQPQEE